MTIKVFLNSVMLEGMITTIVDDKNIYQTFHAFPSKGIDAILEIIYFGMKGATDRVIRRAIWIYPYVGRYSYG